MDRNLAGKRCRLQQWGFHRQSNTINGRRRAYKSRGTFLGTDHGSTMTAPLLLCAPP